MEVMKCMFQVDLKSRKPIYAQVVENFKRLVVSGALPEGEKVPSVRDLAKTLTVNPNTIQKAYRELETQGYIYIVPGQGSFAAAPPKESNQRQVSALYGKLGEIARELLYLGEDPENIVKSVRETSEGMSR
jgi:GntR family transcriptional regulator